MYQYKFICGCGHVEYLPYPATCNTEIPYCNECETKNRQRRITKAIEEYSISRKGKNNAECK
jgi:hypothetical protein